ncbi:hypothetical protein PUV54_07810 [Hyphococcus flavus]|uniref:SURF1-like protein n=1 Tax=Hyphococcus flavus TaxID=1866326 RepID=A0AAF0CCB8_9PROT|nr:SURF1 family cytochrome oxidase biogenesis protein [Hyphococcus flavus]WDI33100.1 hypothetical protein PUV54_07810 [Hyphococcus flavus]
MLSGYRFQFRPALTVFAMAALGILVILGTWQLQRLEWKRGLIAKVEERVSSEPIPFEQALDRSEAGEDMEYTPVRLSGEWRPHNEALVFGAINGKPGAFFFTPLQTAPDQTIFINRGFAPQEATNLADIKDGPDDITGLFRTSETLSPPASWFRPTKKSADGLWFVRDPQLMASQSGMQTPPYYIDQFEIPGREWPKGGTTRLDFNNRHLEYALTWFGLALTLIGVWIAFSLQKR